MSYQMRERLAKANLLPDEPILSLVTAMYLNLGMGRKNEGDLASIHRSVT
jgi:hypothetical protein